LVKEVSSALQFDIAVVLNRLEIVPILRYHGRAHAPCAHGDKRIKEHPQEVKKVVRALYRGLRYAKENPEGTIGVIQKEWKVDDEIAKGSYQAIIKALNDDGIIGEKQLKIHFDLIRRVEKNIGEIPVNKVVDFSLLREVRKEIAGK